mmetsp:Transcript_886/g.1323  ORF Transcript_886/g.1323 Transcript_886/m.1323 type:complete len:446 (+) Transcript_886:162-1499(+)
MLSRHRCPLLSAEQSLVARNPPRLWHSKPLACRQSSSTTTASGTKQEFSSTTEDVEQGKHEGELTCVSSGLDSVVCFVGDDEDTAGLALPLRQPAEPLQEEEPSFWASLLSSAMLVSPFAFWGTSMVAMKTLTMLPPLLVGCLRILPAGLLLVAWAAAQGRPQPSGLKAWGWIIAFALVDGAAFQGFLAQGLQLTPAGLGSVIIDSQPLSVAVLASVLGFEPLTALSVAGLGVGVAGLALLELPEQVLITAADSVLHLGQVIPPLASQPTQLMTQSDMQALAESEHSIFVGEMWMLAAAQSMAVGTVMVRFVSKYVDPVMATGWHMALGGLVLLAICAGSTDVQVLQGVWGQLTPQDYASLFYISLLGGAASYGIYFVQASKPGNLVRLSSMTFLTPVFASVTGYLCLGEQLTAPQILGGAVTLSSVLLINRREPQAKSRAPKQQ